MSLKHFFLIAVFSFGYNLYSQSIVSEIDTSVADVGNPITLAVLIKTVRKEKINLPNLQEQLGMHLKSQGVSYSYLEVNGEQLPKTTIKITVFEPGEYILKPIVFLVGKDTLRTDSYRLKFEENDRKMLKKTSKEGFLGQKPNYIPKKSWKDYFYKFRYFLLLILAVLLYLLYKKAYQTKTEKGEPLFFKENISAKEKALKALREIEKKELSNYSNQKELYTKITAVYRTYLDETQGISAEKLLRKELVSRIKSKDIYVSSRIEEIDAFLALSDMVKFAKAKVDKEDSTAYINQVRVWIESAEPFHKKLDI